MQLHNPGLGILIIGGWLTGTSPRLMGVHLLDLGSFLSTM